MAKIKIIFAVLFFLCAGMASAHELIPAEVRDYLKNNPHATAQEIEQFVQKASPDLASKFKSQGELINAVKNAKTSLAHNAYTFIKLGILHILSGPDHILFILSLLLTFATMRSMFRLTSAFTVAHSITLILAGTSTLVVGSRIVEPMIAFSIAFVAFSSIFLRGKINPVREYLSGTLGVVFAKEVGYMASRGVSSNGVKFFGQENIPMVFIFGLFHGLGFAGLLKEISIPQDRFISSLVFFNVGIELGQILVLLLVVPGIYYFRHRAWYPRFITVAGILLTLIGLFWGIQRIII